MNVTANPGTASSNFEKYETGNPLVQWLIERFLREIVTTIVDLAPVRIVDLGCGEGIVARSVTDRLPDAEYLGVDASAKAVAVARSLNPSLEFTVGDVLDDPLRPGWADLAMSLEVLEHLADPDSAVARILQWTRRDAVVSVPWEPYFRLGTLLRGRYLGAWGNHPEHLQQFTPRRLRQLLSRHCETVRVWGRFPWLIGQLRVA